VIEVVLCRIISSFLLFIFTHIMPGLLHLESNIAIARYRVPGWQCHARSTYRNAGWKTDSQLLQRGNLRMFSYSKQFFPNFVVIRLVGTLSVNMVHVTVPPYGNSQHAFLKGLTQRDVQGRRRNIALEHNPNGKFRKHSINVVTDSSESDKQVSDSE
jgi:hypothetical protein